MKDRYVLEYFKASNNEWRWRLRSPNGRLVATSGEGFTRKWSAKRAGRKALKAWRGSEYYLINKEEKR